MPLGRRSRGEKLVVCAVILFGSPTLAQDGGASRGAVIAGWRATHQRRVLRELADFVALPNLSSDKVNIERNAQHLLGLLKNRGIEARLVEEKGAPPAVFGQLRSDGARHTVVFYAHYDGQPVDPAQWTDPPWKPVLRDKPLELGGREISLPEDNSPISQDARLYGRSSSDDKAPIIAMLSALDALRAASLQPSVNLKFFFEGEEEVGSPHLRQVLDHNRDILQADAWLFCDGPVHQSRRMQLAYGVRGSLGLELTVYGPTRALHDGHYGNWAPNPAALLSRLLATMRNEDGRVLIAGFSERVRPLSQAEKRAVAAVPNIDQDLRGSLGLAGTEEGNAPLSGRILAPAMNIRGLLAGKVGSQAANAIPTEAQASIDFRLVPDQTPDGVKAAVERHLTAHGYHVAHEAPDAATRLRYARIVRVDWEAGYPGVRTSMELPFSLAVARVVGTATAGPIVQLPNMGGSLPLYLLRELLGTPFVIVPTVNHDNNQHASNENIRLQNLWEGIDVFAALFADLEPAWNAQTAGAK